MLQNQIRARLPRSNEALRDMIAMLGLPEGTMRTCQDCLGRFDVSHLEFFEDPHETTCNRCFMRKELADRRVHSLLAAGMKTHYTHE